MRLYSSTLVFAAVIMTMATTEDGADHVGWQFKSYETAEKCLTEYTESQEKLGREPGPNECQDQIPRAWFDYINENIDDVTFSEAEE